MVTVQSLLRHMLDHGFINKSVISNYQKYLQAYENVTETEYVSKPHSVYNIALGKTEAKMMEHVVWGITRAAYSETKHELYTQLRNNDTNVDLKIVIVIPLNPDITVDSITEYLGNIKLEMVSKKQLEVAIGTTSN